MHEIILLIMHTSNLGVQGRPVVESAWNEIIRNVIEEATTGNRSVFDALKDSCVQVSANALRRSHGEEEEAVDCGRDCCGKCRSSGGVAVTNDSNKAFRGNTPKCLWNVRTPGLM